MHRTAFQARVLHGASWQHNRGGLYAKDGGGGAQESEGSQNKGETVHEFWSLYGPLIRIIMPRPLLGKQGQFITNSGCMM